MNRLFWVVTLTIFATAFVIPSTSARAAIFMPVFLALASTIGRPGVTRALALLFPSVILLSAAASLTGAGAHLVAADFIRRSGGEAPGVLGWALLAAPFALLTSLIACGLILMAMAASLLVVVGGAGGYLLRGGGLADTGEVRMAGSVDPMLSAILDQAASGEEIAIGEGQRTVRLVSAFELATGQLCREYELAQPGEPALVSVACRKTSTWQTRLTVAKPEGGDGYAPASSLETVDAFLTLIGAGQPLDAEAEKKALTGSK
ncbi:hypothetical protein [Sinorhizobium sp. GL28]|uniref:hypothetical protein n=1 Tax=Sinorhizobium sp. GL28 TaxID=1358418 RepID=UPI00071DC54B|nr:hypothetical protein [Sinorhizobium sp. GL28]KSV91411.1 hypothetical protein N184_07260 [Sinorhizobium sp. GL28]